MSNKLTIWRYVHPYGRGVVFGGDGWHFGPPPEGWGFEEVEVIPVDSPCVLSVGEVGLLRRLAAVDQLPDDPLSDDEAEAREVIDRLSDWAAKEES